VELGSSCRRICKSASSPNHDPDAVFTRAAYIGAKKRRAVAVARRRDGLGGDRVPGM